MEALVSRPATTDAPPFVAKETEMMVLGGCLEYEGIAGQFVEEGVREAHFFAAHHRLIWRRVVEALREDLGASYPTVRMLLAKHGELEEVSAAYLSSLVQGMPPLRPETVRALSRRLVECAVGRDTLAALRLAETELLERPAALSEGFFARLQANVQAANAQLAGRRLPDHVAHLSEVLAEVVASLKAGPPDFIDTPWPALNTMLGGGFAPGELVFLGARPGVGKTAAALQIARRAGAKGAPVFIVSREMLSVAIATRMLAQAGPVNATFLRKRDLSPQHWSTIDLTVEQLSALPVFMTHAELDIDAIRRIVGTFADEGQIGLVIVDYLQLIDAPAGIKERRLQVEAISSGLKAITLDYQVPVLCLSSLSRPPDGKAPTLSSLRESGNLEHDADTVWFLHRPQELKPTTECIVAKSRNGRTGKAEFFFRGEFLRFEEVDGTYGAA